MRENETRLHDLQVVDDRGVWVKTIVPSHRERETHSEILTTDSVGQANHQSWSKARLVVVMIKVAHDLVDSSR